MTTTTMMTPGTKEKLFAIIGTWGAPPDLASKIAFGLGVGLALLAIARRGRFLLNTDYALTSAATEAELRSDRKRFLAVTALAAALLSIGYISTYLHGGPRIVDATTYFLQGRALSHGHLSWTIPDSEPSASFRGRFLYFNPDAEGGPTLGGIFPPGYPLLLSFGFMLGAPLVVGPAIAAALVIATYWLTRALAEERAPHLAEPIARGAAFLSLVCAALRYHTADTMSHGASALGITVALTMALRARRAPARDPLESSPSPFDDGRGEALLSGLAIGYVVATRPASAIPIALVVAWLLSRADDARPRPRLIVYGLLALLPGVLLLLVSQHAVTGHWLSSTQRMYYATSDGPPNCFRYSFGKNTGCLFEHGDFVHAHLEHGYGILQVIGTTLRRLRPHLLDVASFEPLALLVLVPVLSRKGATSSSRRTIAAATALFVLQVIAYAPFYFDGNYPGGGARFFADVLPVEHALVMLAIASIVERRRSKDGGSVETSYPGFHRGALLVLSLSLLGFGAHAAFEHIKLRDRDNGPMFEPDVLARASLASGLVFIDTDHGFALGYNPSAKAATGVVVARLRNDDRDRMLFEALDRPPTYQYKLDPYVKGATSVTNEGPPHATLVPWAPPEHGTTLRFEAEAEWPPLSQENGFAVPGWVQGCASQSRALVLTPTIDPKKVGQPLVAKTTITIPVPSAGRWSIEPHVVNGAEIPFAPKVPPAAAGTAEGRILIHNPDQAQPTLWTWHPAAPCASLPAQEINLQSSHVTVTIEAHNTVVAVDSFHLRRVGQATPSPR